MPGVKVHNPITGTMGAVAVVVILGGLAYDGIQIAVRHVNAADTANDAAHAGEDVLFDRGTLAQICAGAAKYAKSQGTTLNLDPSIVMATDPAGSVRLGNCRVNGDSSIDVVLHATAQRIVIGRFDKKLLSFTVKGHADKEG